MNVALMEAQIELHGVMLKLIEASRKIEGALLMKIEHASRRDVDGEAQAKLN